MVKDREVSGKTSASMKKLADKIKFNRDLENEMWEAIKKSMGGKMPKIRKPLFKRK